MENLRRTETIKRTLRPWGWYETVSEAPGNKIKRIGVLPGQQISLQKHQRRAEHWVVVQGTARVTLDDVARISADQVQELSAYLQQTAPEVFRQVAELVSSQPAVAGLLATIQLKFSGVSTSAISAATADTLTDSAVLPRPKWVMTLLSDPPGHDATRIMAAPRKPRFTNTPVPRTTTSTARAAATIR